MYVPEKVAKRATDACKTTGRTMSALVAVVITAEPARRGRISATEQTTEMATTAPPDVPVPSLQDLEAAAKARDNVAVIADELDLEYRRTVPGVERRHLARENGADLQADETKSFVGGDIIAEAVDAEGNTTYLAVEAAYAGDLQDADRARSHAALMQRFTNKPCRAVVASTQNSSPLVELIDSGEVAWHQLYIRIEPAS